MNSKATVTHSRFKIHSLAAALAGVMALAGCSNGGEGDEVGFGSGQDPDPVALELTIV